MRLKQLAFINVENFYLEPQLQQAKLFNDPNSGLDVLVASDAIEIGLNLNIKQIVFESIKKHDGIGIRYIPIPQIK
ncbi:P-loop containing nucleoside triphosphate hydrolase protein [Gigaspora margarita]|uniref:P-loop containing nucleoside triphosphate hydrolase protein n=1 Tax=Gigaspora margarita TaxID=4874 RepID=A0A8H4A3H4_GIGMA|nr:P-loop containing nucleoside triphosphate hydrolase protein [Gigaspora margarita]